MAEPLTDEQIEKISASLSRGSKIEAIKLYREFTGQGLKEAKDFVEALAPKLIERDPERYAKLAQAKGCAGVLVVGLLAAGLLAAGLGMLLALA